MLSTMDKLYSYVHSILKNLAEELYVWEKLSVI